MTMSFSFSCGDVLPGCAARFSADDRDELLSQVASHARLDHGVAELDPSLVAAVEQHITTG